MKIVKLLQIKLTLKKIIDVLEEIIDEECKIENEKMDNE